ncbi:MAG: DUF6527 family protein [Aeromicrobium sp.]
MRQTAIVPEFVETAPEDLEPGRLYISIRFRTASHLCACGCGDKVVTPIKPVKWALTYDGETVSLWPSIGRWQSSCKSHYVIRRNKVIWHRTFSKKEIKAVLQKDQDDLRDYYQSREGVEAAQGEAATKPGLLTRVRAWLERAN